MESHGGKPAGMKSSISPTPFGDRKRVTSTLVSGQYNLFRIDSLLRRSDLESSSLVVVQNRGKHARRVEVWKTEPIDRSVHAHQRRWIELSACQRRDADIQTTMLYAHNKERITNAAEHRIPDFTVPPPRENGA